MRSLTQTLATAALTAVLGFAQATGTTSGAGSSGTTGSGATGAGAAGSSQGSHGSHSGQQGSGSASGDMVGGPDKAFMMKAAQGGLAEVQLAEMAEQKATREDIKEFARKLKQDHSDANQKLMAIAKERNVQLPTDLGHHQAMVTKLNGLSGAAFDNAWTKMQVQHHKKDVSDFRKQANRGLDSDLKGFASATLPTLEQHLQTAQGLASNRSNTRSRSNDQQGGSMSGSGSAGHSGGHSGTAGQSGSGSQGGSTGQSGSSSQGGSAGQSGSGSQGGSTGQSGTGTGTGSRQQ
ncbi:MAG TPA: DUF4142 domain-containing protein [Bryobacteraceae bacterium]|nr:DUF4142 domain-containing protein [Bryobacteraceae bacterium]